MFELDAKVKEGLFIEKEAYEDYFALDNLEAERDKIKKYSEKLYGVEGHGPFNEF